jgi:DNA-directed RNA polymerase specialized sigma24 family protein
LTADLTLERIFSRVLTTAAMAAHFSSNVAGLDSPYRNWSGDAESILLKGSRGSPVQKAEPKKGWVLTPEAFDLLLKWLDEGCASNGQRYLEMRRRLVAYFDRKRCLNPDELADETLNRVARRLAEEGVTETKNSAKYCYIVARFVFMESLRGTPKDVPLDDIPQQANHEGVVASELQDTREIKERMLDCLERCTGGLEPVNHDIIRRYYMGKERIKIENRRALAKSLGISMNALSVRACRIRDKLHACVKHCMDAE